MYRMTIQCLDRQVELDLAGDQRLLKAGELMYLKAGAAHTVSALTDTVLLITILLDRELL